MRAPHTLRNPGFPSCNTRNISLTIALRMVRMYGDRVPSVERIQADFDVHRATAYRWRGAFVDAMEQDRARSGAPLGPSVVHA